MNGNELRRVLMGIYMFFLFVGVIKFTGFDESNIEHKFFVERPYATTDIWKVNIICVITLHLKPV